MRPPVISIVLRGYQDRFGFQKLFLRYAWRYQTNYLVLPWKVLPKDWDPAGQSVKPRATLGGETAMVVNNHLRTTLTKAYSIVADMIARDIPPAFDLFSQKMRADKKVVSLFGETALQILKEEHAANEISPKTYITYKSAVNKFQGVMGPLRLQDISREKVLEFKRKMVATGKENLANQYVRYLKIIYGRVLKHFELDDQRKPFDRVEIKVVKISEKKSLTLEEYAAFRNALAHADVGSQTHETLRRFLIMCRGLRFSDTQRIKKDTHYFEFQEDDTWYRYFATNAQKTGSKEIVPISNTDATMLLHWRQDGYLFPQVKYMTYSKWLRKVSLDLIGREITTHYGRHFTGDFILNNGDMGIEDVKKILGVKSDRIAEIYAQKDIKEVLKKFYAAVEGLEGK
jgi:integrase